MVLPVPGLAPVMLVPPLTDQLNVAFGSVLEILTAAFPPLQKDKLFTLVATSKQINLNCNVFETGWLPFGFVIALI